jgi:hypothetical protein
MSAHVKFKYVLVGKSEKEGLFSEAGEGTIEVSETEINDEATLNSKATQSVVGYFERIGKSLKNRGMVSDVSVQITDLMKV